MNINPKSKRIHLAMKILFVAILCMWASPSFSQANVISLSFNDITLEEALGRVRQESEYSLWYRNEDINLNKKVSLDVTNGDITTILDVLLEGENLKYVIEEKHIVIFKDKAPAIRQTAARRHITGTIVDGDGEPVVGCIVQEKSSSNATLSNGEGRFALDVAPNAVLQISSLGYLPQEVSTSNRSNLTVTMIEDTQTMEEVVVVGYGVARKSDLTGAISSVRAESMQKYTPSTVGDFLRTSVPGMRVGYSLTAKGNSDMMIRGNNTLSAGSAPLIVIDGVIYNGDISDINPSDIEKLDIMKDASSAAVYGSRATNGVVAITTKKGAVGKPVVNFTGSVGVGISSNRLEPYDADGFIQWRSDLMKSTYSATVAQTPWSPFDDPRTIDRQYLGQWMAYHSTTEENLVDAWLAGLRLTGLEIENYKEGKTIDWEKHIFQTSLRQDYNVSLSGRNNDVSYYWSLGYLDNEGLVVGDEFSTVRSRINVEGSPAKFLKVGMNTQFSYRDESSVPADQGRYQALTPYGSFYDNEGEKLRMYPNDDIQSVHPLLERTYRTREQEYFTLFPKLYATVNLPFGITYTMNYTTRFVFYHRHVHNSSEHPQWGLYGGDATRENSLRREWQIDNIINWNRTFANHHRADVTLLANAEKFRTDTEMMTNRGFNPSDILGYHNMALGILPEITSDDQVRTADALMARVNYSYKNKYLLTMSVRRDGSSLFGYSNPYGTFPAAALGWVISEEDFFKVPFVDYLKLRVSWGLNGNRDIDNYAALSRMVADKYLNTDQNGNAIVIPTLEINTMGNKSLRWEKTEAYNFALDFRLLRDRLSGSVETYSMSTIDALVRRQLPTITGYPNVFANLGKIKNRGFELSLNSVNIKRPNMEWRTDLVFSLNRNEIVSITGEMVDVLDANGKVIGQKEANDTNNGWFIGQPKDVIWDYKILGTWKTGQEEDAAKWGQSPGDFILEDVDADGLLTDADKQFLGIKSPRYSWALTNTFTLFKDFDISFVVYSLWGRKAAFNLAKHDNHVEDRMNSRDIPYWTPDNQMDDFARLRSAPAKGVTYSAWFDQSYIRLENFSIGYRVPAGLFGKTSISNLRVTLNVRNVGFWAPVWKFSDPEDGTRAPKIFTLGINMSL